MVMMAEVLCGGQEVDGTRSRSAVGRPGRVGFFRHANGVSRKGIGRCGARESPDGRPERTMRPLRQDSEIGGTWALVLAGGSGTRLRSLTTRDDVFVPKQYCALRRGPSLLTQTLIRAASVAPTARTCAVVAAQHRWCWESQLASMPRANVFVQPQDRGTAHGVLLALLQLHA